MEFADRAELRRGRMRLLNFSGDRIETSPPGTGAPRKARRLHLDDDRGESAYLGDAGLPAYRTSLAIFEYTEDGSC